jgi:hypothetical protein
MTNTVAAVDAGFRAFSGQPVSSAPVQRSDPGDIVHHPGEPIVSPTPDFEFD